LYQKGNYELRILFESELLVCVLGVMHIAMPENGVGTLPMPERIHIMYYTSPYKIGIGWEVSLIPIHVI
jgi:hypothetical protein